VSADYPADTLLKVVEAAKDPALQEDNRRAKDKVLEQASKMAGANNAQVRGGGGAANKSHFGTAVVG